MDAIEVLYAFYGALLALAAGKLLSGVVRLVKRREAVRVGWLTPLLTLLLVFDLAACATNGWRSLGSADMSLQVVLVCMLSAGSYYFAASLLTPDALAPDGPAPNGLADIIDLDVWYRRNKRYVVGGMLVGNILGFELLTFLIKGLDETFTTRWTGFSALMNGMFYLLLVMLMLMRNRATDTAMLVVLNALYVIALVSA